MPQNRDDGNKGIGLNLINKVVLSNHLSSLECRSFVSISMNPICIEKYTIQNNNFFSFPIFTLLPRNGEQFCLQFALLVARMFQNNVFQQRWGCTVFVRDCFGSHLLDKSRESVRNQLGRLFHLKYTRMFVGNKYPHSYNHK